MHKNLNHLTNIQQKNKCLITFKLKTRRELFVCIMSVCVFCIFFHVEKKESLNYKINVSKMGHKSQLNFQHFANKRIGDLGFHAWARAQVLKFDAKQYFCSLQGRVRKRPKI